MAQALVTLKEENQYLQISEEDGVVENVSAEPKEALPITSALFAKITPFYYRSRIRLSMFVADQFKSQYVMLRGLIEFSRPRTFSFAYNRSQNLIEIDVESTEVKAVEQFFERILALLKHEMQFRHALKIALEFENRYKLEMESVYRIMNNTMAAARRNY